LFRPENPLIVKEVPVRHSTRSTRVPALLGAAALLTASLAGCSAIPGFGGCDPAFAGGDASSIVTATGKIGSEPKVDFPTPLVVDEPEVSRVEAGDGAPVAKDGQVDYAVSYYNGETGEQLGATGYGDIGSDDPPARSAVGLGAYAISDAFECTSVGDRIVLTSTAGQAFGEGEAGIPDETVLVLVIDVLDTFRGKADGFNQLPQDGMPVVVTAVDGTPAISLTGLTKPTTTRAATIKAGDGATAREGDTVHVHLRVWTWPGEGGAEPTQFADTWSDRRQSFDLVLTDEDGSAFPPGVRDAIVGAKAGSQLLVVVPPGPDSYATPPQGLDADATMIWVVDILGVQKQDADK
jgi:peptidylprolyl isomerase